MPHKAARKLFHEDSLNRFKMQKKLSFVNSNFVSNEVGLWRPLVGRSHTLHLDLRYKNW